MLQSRFRSRGAAPVTDSKWRGAEAPIPILVASAQDSDHAAFRNFLEGTRYFAVAGEDFDRASRLLCHIVFPILVCDARFDGRNGLFSLGCLVGVARVPALVLLCDACDSETATEVFDVLVRPFDAGTLLPALDAAHRNWERGVRRKKPAAAAGLAAGAASDVTGGD